MPIKDRRTKLLLLFFLTTTEARPSASSEFGFISISERLQQIFDISLNQKTKGTLSSMLREGLLEKETAEVPQTEVRYRLTEQGFDELSLQFPFVRYLRSDWDGLWRIISYEIPETKRHLRDSLRREMKGWGLGPWHRSFWVTPHPIISNLRDLVYGREESQYIQAFESTHMYGDLDVFVEKVWEKTKLEQGYRELFKKWHSVLSENIDKTGKMSRVMYSYIEYLRNDPGLPKSLVGEEWIGFEALSIFVEMRGILLS